MAAIGESNGHLVVRDPDIAIMLRVRADEPGAFRELVQKYEHRLVGVLHHIMGDAAEAEDLAQEVFLRIYRARRKYRATAKFSTWLFTIANNLALNALRNRQRKPVVPFPANDAGPLGPRPAERLAYDHRDPPSQRLANQELSAVVRRAVESLNERQRMAVLLNKFAEMNYADIAAVMGLSTKAVKSLLSRARSNLRVALEPYIRMEARPIPETPQGGRPATL